MFSSVWWSTGAILQRCVESLQPHTMHNEYTIRHGEEEGGGIGGEGVGGEWGAKKCAFRHRAINSSRC